MRQFLTNRERQIVGLLLDGLHRKEIADRLGIASKTVDSILAQCFQKHKVHGAVELIAKLCRAVGVDVKRALIQ